MSNHKEEAMQETTARFVVVSATKHEARPSELRLEHYRPELTTEELDAISDEDYDRYLAEWENDGFSGANRDGALTIETGIEWPVGTVLEVSVRAIGTREEVDTRRTKFA